MGSHSDIDRRIADIASKMPPDEQDRARAMQERLERASKHQSDIIEDLGDKAPTSPWWTTADARTVKPCSVC